MKKYTLKHILYGPCIFFDDENIPVHTGMIVYQILNYEIVPFSSSFAYAYDFDSDYSIYVSRSTAEKRLKEIIRKKKR